MVRRPCLQNVMRRRMEMNSLQTCQSLFLQSCALVPRMRLLMEAVDKSRTYWAFMQGKVDMIIMIQRAWRRFLARRERKQDIFVRNYLRK